MLGLWQAGTGPQHLSLHVAFSVDIDNLLQAAEQLREANIIPLDFNGEPPTSQSVLHNFTGGKDGAYPYAPLIRDARGNLYGTTLEGGTGCKPYGCGTVFKVDATGKETVLHASPAGWTQEALQVWC